MNKIEVVVVTGMSGAGKTQAMAIFENMEDKFILTLILGVQLVISAFSKEASVFLSRV